MKTLGLIGGLSWFSTSVYYKTINQLINERLGGSHSAKLFLYSVDFNEFKTLQEKNDWEQIESMLSGIARRLEDAGADCLVMCTNTPHLVADAIRQKIKIPLIHIAEETAKAIVKQGASKVGLIGTKFTMENSFFKDCLSKFGLEPMIPSGADRDFIHASIFNELTKGIFKEETKNKYLEIIEKLRADGAQGVIFGCTEISLLVNQSDCNVTVYDTTAIHSRAAVDFALSDDLKE
jgi:aspartate racemase